MKSKKRVLIVAILVLVGIYAFTELLDSFSTKATSVTYETYCAGCHGHDGEGLGTLIPPIAESDWLVKNSEQLPCVILYGMNDSIEVNGITYYHEMLGVGEFLSNIELYNLTNFVRNEMGNELGFIPSDSIQKLVDKCN